MSTTIDVPGVADNVPPRTVQLHTLANDLERYEWVGHDSHGRKGAQTTVLFDDPASGQRVALVRCEPGAFSAPHRHEGHESFLILEGTFHDDSGVYGKGELLVYQPGSYHGWTCPDGGLFYAVWGGPVTPLAPNAG